MATSRRSPTRPPSALSASRSRWPPPCRADCSSRGTCSACPRSTTGAPMTGICASRRRSRRCWRSAGICRRSRRARGTRAMASGPTRPSSRSPPMTTVQRRSPQACACGWSSCWLDSSLMAALARPHVDELHTFAAGLEGAPDLHFARQVADYLGTTHHEIVVTLDDLLAALPAVIYHLESFDALLVRSSVTNYLAARYASGYVESVLSGEGADELFGGYAYLKDLSADDIPGELLDITRRLHNTALQRVDRSASAHELVAHVPFLDTEVVR